MAQNEPGPSPVEIAQEQLNQMRGMVRVAWCVFISILILVTVLQVNSDWLHGPDTKAVRDGFETFGAFALAGYLLFLGYAQVQLTAVQVAQAETASVDQHRLVAVLERLTDELTKAAARYE